MGYFNLDEFGFSAMTAPPGSLRGNAKIAGMNLDAVGIWPLTEKLSAIGRVGVAQSEAKDRFAGTGAVAVVVPSTRERETNAKFGIGLQYEINRYFDVRAEAERYRVTDGIRNTGDIDLVSLGLVLRFGGGRQAYTEQTTTQSSMDEGVESYEPAPAPVAAPVLVVVPVVAKREEYCSILDLQFDINRDSIEREDLEKLSVVGTFMTKYPETTAVIEGHADNIGSAEENMTLSQHRAESVVSYLLKNYRIDPSRLKAVGYGFSRPLADNSTEEGKRQNRRINAVIACATDMEGLKPVAARITMAMEMEFDENRVSIKPQYHDELRKVAAFMKANPRVRATVEGHTSDIAGTAEMRMELSRNRAGNVVNHLVDTLGVERSRLSIEGFGQTRRFSYNTSLEGQRENRRVNIIFTYPK
ncbi:MAG: OmpA family protein [Moraxellaceae bacterium]|nr:OmpA family protein [Moraxellaceae bacterium]